MVKLSNKSGLDLNVEEQALRPVFRAGDGKGFSRNDSPDSANSDPCVCDPRYAALRTVMRTFMPACASMVTSASILKISVLPLSS